MYRILDILPIFTIMLKGKKRIGNIPNQSNHRNKVFFRISTSLQPHGLNLY